jgi:hypothetical protein
MRKLNSKNRVFLLATFFVALSLTMFSCLRIFKMFYPEEVETNSVFEVRFVLDDLRPNTDYWDHGHHNCWGYVGLQLPVGWTIEAEDLEYEWYPGEPPGAIEGVHTDTVAYHKGSFEYAAGYVENCFAGSDVYLEEDYYITGFQTLRHESECMDSIVVTLKIHTDGQLGDKILTLYVQENGDETYVISGDPETGKPLFPGNMSEDKTTYTPKSASHDEGSCVSYLEIKAVPGGTDGIQTVTNDGSFSVVAIGNGQLQTSLSDSKKIGAKAIVYNMQGQIVTTRILNQTRNLISGLTPGTYAVGVEKDGIRSVKKVIVK